MGRQMTEEVKKFSYPFKESIQQKKARHKIVFTPAVLISQTAVGNKDLEPFIHYLCI